MPWNAFRYAPFNENARRMVRQDTPNDGHLFDDIREQ
jgi:hypothetical protein